MRAVQLPEGIFALRPLKNRLGQTRAGKHSAPFRVLEVERPASDRRPQGHCCRAQGLSTQSSMRSENIQLESEYGTIHAGPSLRREVLALQRLETISNGN